jgi:N-dimethylarginine dimethylaminohydrolase
VGKTQGGGGGHGREPAQQFLKDSQGKPLREVDPDLYERSVNQLDDLVVLLESKGVVVHRPKPLTPDEEEFLAVYKAGIQQCFTRDPILVIGNNVIETWMREFERRRERFGMRRTIQERLFDGNANWVSMPQAAPVRGAAG